MPIPPLDEDGLLPPGVHDCTLEEVEERFGRFQKSDQRIRLFVKLQEYLREVQLTGFAVALLIDGSFVTAKPEPEDIDLVLVLKPDHDFLKLLRPFEYNVISKHRVRRHFRFNLVLVGEGSTDFDKAVRFFQQVRDRSDRRKGLLRVSLS